MANPMPCQNCLEIADAEFMVSNRLNVPWPFEQSTVALCVPCFIHTGIAMGEALQAAMAELEAQATADELAQIHANDPPEVPAEPEPKSRRKPAKEQEPVGVVAEAAQEAEASDD